MPSCMAVARRAALPRALAGNAGRVPRSQGARTERRLTLIAPGVYLRRGALPRPPDRYQVVDELPETNRRAAILQLFPPSARRLAR